MKNSASTPKPTLYCHRCCALGLLALLLSLTPPAVLAKTIIIGKGTGILWEGLPFTASLSGSMEHARLNVKHGLLAVSSSKGSCQGTGFLKVIAGYPALEIAPGVGLIPRASGQVGYYTFMGSFVLLSGTLGLPETKGVSSNGTQVTSPEAYSWRLPPAMTSQEYFYSPSTTRAAVISGTWVLVADGQQKAAEITLPEMYAASFSEVASGDRRASILPSDFKLRISTLECAVNTPISIAFGNVMKDPQAGAELAVQSYPLITSCGQSSDLIDANINLQFRPLTGLYQSAATRLALREGGGYITGEIDNGVTGSGSCSATSGLPFDNSQLKIGRITKAQTSLNITHQVTWRLCSGGKDLPLGNVSAAAEMLVTFN